MVADVGSAWTSMVCEGLEYGDGSTLFDIIGKFLVRVLLEE